MNTLNKTVQVEVTINGCLYSIPIKISVDVGTGKPKLQSKPYHKRDVDDDDDDDDEIESSHHVEVTKKRKGSDAGTIDYSCCGCKDSAGRPVKAKRIASKKQNDRMFLCCGAGGKCHYFKWEDEIDA